MSLPITGFYTSILGIILVYLSILVIRERRSGRVSLGDGNVEELPYLQALSRIWQFYRICPNGGLVTCYR